MKNLILILVCFMTIQCSRDDESNDLYVNNINVDFEILNQEGNDLLNPGTEGYFEENNLELYYLINDNLLLAQDYDSQIGNENGIILISETSPYRLRIFTNPDTSNHISEENGIKYGQNITYLKFSEEDTDTIVTEWEYKEGYYFKNKRIWYNNVEHSEGEVFTITK